MSISGSTFFFLLLVIFTFIFKCLENIYKILNICTNEAEDLSGVFYSKGSSPLVQANSLFNQSLNPTTA